MSLSPSTLLNLELQKKEKKTHLFQKSQDQNFTNSSINMNNPLAQVSLDFLCFWVSFFNSNAWKKGKDKETFADDVAETVKFFCKCMNKG